ncbi:MAG: class I adenylate-forming enzyme family protein [Clostridia bacterium]
MPLPPAVAEVTGAQAPFRHHWPETSGAMIGDRYLAMPPNLTAAFRQAALRWADRLALSDEQESVTYGALEQRMLSTAAVLWQEGVRPGDVVGVLQDSRISYLVWLLATVAVGAVPALLNVRLTQAELEPLVRLVKPRLMVAGETHWERACALPVRTVLPAERTPLGYGTLSGLPGEHADPHGDALLLFTSGTTAGPKAARLTHANVLHSAESYHRIFGLTNTDVTLIAVPLFHVTGLIGQWLSILLAGGESVLLSRFDAARADALMRARSVSFVFCVPTLFIRMLRYWQGQEDAAPPPFLRVAASGGAPMPESVLEALSGRLSCGVFNTYGLTEVASPATILPAGDVAERPGSAGLPAPGVSLRVVNPETLMDAAPGEAGELLVAGPMVMAGYYDNPVATRNVMVSLEQEYLRTGDLARIDAAGFVFVLDRLKDLINRGGEKIYGGEVEQALYRHPDVIEASVVGIPDPEWGEVVGAAVVLRHGDPGSLRPWLRERLAAYKVPTRWVCLDELPRNANGKVDRRRVRELLS